MCISLKRFIQKPRGGFEKIDMRIHFPETLNLDNYTIVKSPITEDLSDEILSGAKSMNNYDLYAVIVHSGGMNGGHYYSYAKHKVE